MIKEKPPFFNFDRVAPETPWPAVKSIPAYDGAVVEAMAKKGYCAKDDARKIAVNGLEHGQRSSSTSTSRTSTPEWPGIYRATCYRAAF